MSGRVWSKFWGSCFAETPNNNGVGRFVQQLQRVTIKFCKEKTTSQGTREFIERDLIHYARANPGVVVYLKPRRNRTPAIKAEYLNGEVEYLSLYRRPRDQIVKWLHHYNTRSGQPTMRLRQKHHTDLLSIQGTWTPWTHKHPDTFTMTFPNAEAGAAEKIEKTATDQLLEIAQKSAQKST